MSTPSRLEDSRFRARSWRTGWRFPTKPLTASSMGGLGSSPIMSGGSLAIGVCPFQRLTAVHTH